MLPQPIFSFRRPANRHPMTIQWNPLNIHRTRIGRASDFPPDGSSDESGNINTLRHFCGDSFAELSRFAAVFVPAGSVGRARLRPNRVNGFDTRSLQARLYSPGRLQDRPCPFSHASSILEFLSSGGRTAQTIWRNYHGRSQRTDERGSCEVRAASHHTQTVSALRRVVCPTFQSVSVRAGRRRNSNSQPSRPPVGGE